MTDAAARTQAVLDARRLLREMVKTPSRYFNGLRRHEIEPRVRAILEHLPGAEDFCPRPYMTSHGPKERRPHVSPKLFDARVALDWINQRGAKR